MPKPAKRKLTSPKQKRRPTISRTFCEGLGKVPNYESEVVETCSLRDGLGQQPLELIDDRYVCLVSTA